MLAGRKSKVRERIISTCRASNTKSASPCSRIYMLKLFLFRNSYYYFTVSACLGSVMRPTVPTNIGLERPPVKDLAGLFMNKHLLDASWARMALANGTYVKWVSFGSNSRMRTWKPGAAGIDCLGWFPPEEQSIKSIPKLESFFCRNKWNKKIRHEIYKMEYTNCTHCIAYRNNKSVFKSEAV